MKHLVLGFLFLVGSTSALASPPLEAPARRPSKPAPAPNPYWDKLPAIAVWDLGDRILRFALWEDGKIVFAADPARWGGALRVGRLDPAATRKLLDEVSRTGLFDLPGNCYLVPDAPVYATLARFDGRQQMLYWDEVERPNYGINIALQPHHIAFKRTWYGVTKAISKRLPAKSKPLDEQFSPPRSWIIKEAIQSK